jgi:hypothetical protein
MTDEQQETAARPCEVIRQYGWWEFHATHLPAKRDVHFQVWCGPSRAPKERRFQGECDLRSLEFFRGFLKGLRRHKGELGEIVDHFMISSEDAIDWARAVLANAEEDQV